MTRPLVSIILPTFNEAENITPLLSQLIKVLSRICGPKFEIIVIDDNSPDQTFQKVQQFSTRHHQIRGYRHPGPPELGDSILTGIKQARGQFIIGMDADFNHDPVVIRQLLKTLRKTNLVIASRFIPGGGMADKWRYLTSLAFNLLLRIGFGFPILDNTSGFYAIRRSDLLMLQPDQIYRGYGEYHLRLLAFAQKSKYLIAEVPVFYQNRIKGESKSNFIKMIPIYLKTAYHLTYDQK